MLAQARRHHPDVVRMAFAHVVEAEDVVPLVFGAHRCLDKPLQPSELVAQLARVRQLRSRLGVSLRGQLGELDQLPSMPRVFALLGQALARPNVSALSLAQLVEQDSALAAKVLQLANSSFVSRGQAVADLQQAIVRTGVQTLRALTLLVEVFELPALTASDRRALQRHALLTARLAAALVGGRGDVSELAYSAGLLHDIGKLALAVQRPVLFEACWRQAGAGFAYDEAEQVVLPPGHAPLGAYLLGLWGLPDPIVDAVMQHHDPMVAGPRDVTFALQLANHLANEVLLAGDPLISDDEAGTLAIASDLPRWRALALEEHDRLLQLF